MIWSNLLLFILWSFFNRYQIATGFLGPHFGRKSFTHKQQQQQQQQQHQQLLHLFPSSPATFSHYSTLIVSNVPVFDGSNIHDPLVVSNHYWENIWQSISTWLFSQFLVGILASIALFFSTTQLISLGEFISSRVLTKEHDDSSFPPTSNKSWSHIDTKRPDRVAKLALCIVIDLMGSASEFVPVVGEVFDLIWAPLAAYALRSLFAKSNVIFVLEFMEEILPITDFIPLATICWIIETYFDDSNIAKALQIGRYASPQ